MTAPLVIGNAALYCGDCMELLDNMRGASCVVMDPP